MSYYLNPWCQRDISIIVRGFNTQIEFWIEISFPKNAIEAIKQANFGTFTLENECWLKNMKED